MQDSPHDISAFRQARRRKASQRRFHRNDEIATEASDTWQMKISGKIREYWIRADSFFTHLFPGPDDLLIGKPFNAPIADYWALGYRAYTPGWGSLLTGSADIGMNSGIPGPILRAEIGDIIRVHFQNNNTHYGFPLSLRPHGVVPLTPSNELSAGRRGWLGTVIAVGETFTYEWIAAPNSIGQWMYHDHSMPAPSMGEDHDSSYEKRIGLFGRIIIS